MDLHLNDRTALVFGAGGGLGGEIAISLAGEAVSGAVADIDAASAQARRTRNLSSRRCASW